MSSMTAQQRRSEDATRNRWKILTDIPYIKLITVVIMGLIVLIGFIRSITFGQATPFLPPVLATVLSALAILFIDLKESYGTTYMRIGYHMGLLIFISSFPILAPETIPNIDETVRFTAGLALVVAVIGFEVGYWIFRTFTGTPRLRPPFMLVANNYSWISRLLLIGIASYLLFLVYAVASSGRSFFAIFFVLRGELLVNTDELLITPDENKNLIAIVLGYGRYLAAAASIVLILGYNPHRFAINKTLAWLALIGCAFIGLNSASGGSRSSFLLSTVPLLTTLWIYLGTIKGARQFRPVLAIASLAVVYFGFQYLAANRGSGARMQDDDVQFNIDRVDFWDTYHLSAFSIYPDYEFVIGAFPSKEQFQNGASLVPFFLGWVPRRFWPDKPFPFTRIATELRGFRVGVVSIASGLPAEGYGNFGLPGALLWGALMGLGCALADFRMSNLRPGHPLALSMRGMMAVWAAIIVRGGTAEMFYMGVFPIGFMWICLYFSEPRQLKNN